jgi:16S rRNA (guanine966-N2)-methyltransferase
VVRADSTRLPHRSLGATLVFVDPPYGKSLISPALVSASQGGWLAAGALVVIELPAAETPVFPPGFREVDDRRYGATRILCTQYGT